MDHTNILLEIIAVLNPIKYRWFGIYLLIIFDERYSIENKLCEFYYVVTQLPSALKYAKFQPNRIDTYEDAVEKIFTHSVRS